MASPFFFRLNIHMKHLKAQNKLKEYDTVTLGLEEIVPASTYEVIPDESKLKPSIENGEMDYPIMLLDTDQKYWQNVHERYYRKSNPNMPEVAPERNGRVLVVWKGRQRYQLAKELGYTHIDCVLEKDLHKIVTIAMEEKKDSNA